MKKLLSILLICCTLIACSSVKKHKTIEQSKSDSTIDKVNDIVVDKKQENFLDNKTIKTNETVVNVEFEGDTCNDIKPVSIVAKDGKINIDPGGRKIKSVNANIKNNIDSSTKVSTNTAEKTTDKSTSKVEVKKENKAVEIDKKSSRSKIIFSIAALGALFGIFLFFKKKKKQVEEII